MSIPIPYRRSPVLSRSTLAAACGLIVWTGALVGIWALTGQAWLEPGAIPRTFRLRCELRSTTPLTVGAVFELPGGKLANPASLGTARDDPGTLSIERGRLHARRKSARVIDGWEFDLPATEAEILKLSLHAPELNGWEETIELKLVDLLTKGVALDLCQGQLRLDLARAPGDELQVDSRRAHWIYDPGETVEFELRHRSLEPARGPGSSLQWKIKPARSTRTLAYDYETLRETENGDSVCALNFAAPQAEGVYDLHLSVRNRLGSGPSRVVQFVVLPSRAAESKTAPSDLKPDEVSATDLSRLIPIRRTQKSERTVDEFRTDHPGKFRAVNSGSVQRTWTESMQRWLGKGSGNSAPPAAGELGWRAYHLRLQQPGRAHRVTLEWDSGQAAELGASLIEPNAAGQVVAESLDLAWQVAAEPLSLTGGEGSAKSRDTAASADKSSASRTRVRRELIFWPRVTGPVLVLYQPTRTTELPVVTVQVDELPPEPFVSAPHSALTKGASATDLTTDSNSRTIPTRWLGVSLSEPVFSELFGGVQVKDRQSGLSLDDWELFRMSAERMVQALAAEGHNTLVLPVMTDGMALYPSRFVDSGTRFDSGMWQSDGQDPQAKDLVEMWLRLCERYHIRLIAELQYNSPLPAVERLLNDPERANGILLQNRVAAGSRLLPEMDSSGYNPLDPRVQQAALTVLQELVSRYGQRPAFAGVSLLLTENSWLSLPGNEWGTDPSTLSRFSQSPEAAGVTQLRPRMTTAATATSGPAAAAGVGSRAAVEPASASSAPEAASANQPAVAGTVLVSPEDLQQKYRAEWTAWRSKELSRFYRRLANVVCGQDERLVLLLNCRGLSVSEEQRSRTRPGTDPALAARGIDPTLISDLPRVIWVRSRLDSASSRTPAVTNESGSGKAAEMAVRSLATGFLQDDPVQSFALPELETTLPWQPAQVILQPTVRPEPNAQQQQLARSVTSGDPLVLLEGGSNWIPGQTGPWQRLRQQLNDLPAQPLEIFTNPAGSGSSSSAASSPSLQTGSLSTAPVIVRFGHDPRQTFLYAVNDSSLTIRLELQGHAPAALRGRLLGSQSPAPLMRTGVRDLISAAAKETSPTKESTGKEPVGTNGLNWKLNCTLQPFEIWGVVLDRPDAELQRVEVGFPEEELVRLEQRLKSLEHRSSQLEQQARKVGPAFPNASFELGSHQAQNLPGWESPVQQAAWSLDRENPHSGQQALCLLSGTREAILSQDWQLPINGEWMLAVWLRTDRPKMNVRLTAEQGTSSDRTSAHTVQVGPAWQRFSLPTPASARAGGTGIRLRIEPLDQGRLWVDDVEVISGSVTLDELRQLTKTVAAAKLAWEQQRSADCQRLLDTVALTTDQSVPVKGRTASDSSKSSPAASRSGSGREAAETKSPARPSEPTASATPADKTPSRWSRLFPR